MPGLLLDPDPHQCRAVLASLCRCAPAPDALAFLDDMRRWGVSPGRSDHRAVIDALLREGKAVEAYEFVTEQMDADGVALGLPELEMFLRAFRESESFDAVEVFDEMLLRGLVPGVRVYDVYVGALCDRGDLAGARRMLGCMERAGCPPDGRTFGVVAAGGPGRGAGGRSAGPAVGRAGTGGRAACRRPCRAGAAAAAAAGHPAWRLRCGIGRVRV